MLQIFNGIQVKGFFWSIHSIDILKDKTYA